MKLHEISAGDEEPLLVTLINQMPKSVRVYFQKPNPGTGWTLHRLANITLVNDDSLRGVIFRAGERPKALSINYELENGMHLGYLVSPRMFDQVTSLTKKVDADGEPYYVLHNTHSPAMEL
jgi:hypothetical protein